MAESLKTSMCQKEALVTVSLHLPEVVELHTHSFMRSTLSCVGLYLRCSPSCQSQHLGRCLTEEDLMACTLVL